MSSRSFLRAVLAGALVVAAALLAVMAYRALTPEPPQPAGKFDPSNFVASPPRLDAPYVATDYEVVDAMLAMARVRPGDYVIDLGSGDGRILIAAARSHGARGLGIEIDPARIAEANANAQAARVTHLIEFRRQDLFETPLQEADVLTLYLTREVNLRLRPRIFSQMRPGARVVSHDFDMGDWRPDQRQQVGSASLYMWIVPAQFEGQWRLEVDGRTATLDLEQNFQEVEGTITGDGTGRVEQGHVYGRAIRFVADAGNGRREYLGRIDGNRIVPIRGQTGWQAVRTS
jgi:SAM-dependent methyltransferase